MRGACPSGHQPESAVGMTMYYEDRNDPLLAPLYALMACRLTFRLEALDDVWLPDYKGFSLRGALDTAFRMRALGLDPDRYMPEDHLKSRLSNPPDAYTRWFRARAHPVWQRLLDTNATLPPPFVLAPPGRRDNYLPSGTFISFDLTLFGRAADDWRSFVEAVEWYWSGLGGLGTTRARCRLHGVYDGRGQLCYTDGLPLDDPARFYVVPGPSEEVPDAFTLHLLTPLRLRKHKQDLTPDRFVTPEGFTMFLALLYRRLFLLTQIYATPAPELDRLATSELARWRLIFDTPPGCPSPSGLYIKRSSGWAQVTGADVQEAAATMLDREAPAVEVFRRTNQTGFAPSVFFDGSEWQVFDADVPSTCDVPRISRAQSTLELWSGKRMTGGNKENTSGLVGRLRLRLRRVSPAVVTLLVAGTSVHVGSDTVAGLGRYEMI